MFVYRNHDGYGSRGNDVHRIVKDWPFETLPLREQATAVGMLFLNDAHHGDFAVFDKIGNLFVPTWHMLTTASSPGREVKQQNLLATVIFQRNRFPRFDIR